MSEKSNWKNESHGQEEIKDEEEKSSKLIHWISLLLLRIKLQYNLSNTLLTVLLNLLLFIFKSKLLEMLLSIIKIII